MNIEINKNNILTIFNENIPQTKEYTYNVSGYTFSDFDTGIIVLHKKERKTINLKNLSDNMNVCYIAQRKQIMLPLDTEGFMSGLYLFDGFDETTGKKYHFIPKFSEEEKESFNKKCTTLKIPAAIEKSEKWFLIKGSTIHPEHAGKYASFLFALLFLFGKWESKKRDLTSIKIQIPLFGQYMKREDMLDEVINSLQKEWIFLKTDKLQNNNGITYQISCNDYELLEMYAKWYEPVEKFEKITKGEFTQEMKTKLLEYITNDPEIPQKGKKEVIQAIEIWTIKLLTK